MPHSRALAVQVFAKAHIQNPVQLVLDAKVLANPAIQPRRFGRDTDNVIADFALGFARGLMLAFILNAYQPL